MKNSLKNGFALLYAVLVVGVMMSLVFAVLNIVYKQIILSNANQNSMVSFYASDSGLECGRYWSAYGAFNPSSSNPDPSGTDFSKIECAGTVLGPGGTSGYTDCSGLVTSNCGLVGDGYNNISNTSNPVTTDYTPNTFYYNFFTYSLTPLYSHITPLATANIWQTEQSDPTVSDPSDLTTGILSAGVNTNVAGPNQLQRGSGEAVAITQCLAPAFTYSLNGGGSYQYVQNINWQPFAEAVTPYFPGKSITQLISNIKDTLGLKSSSPKVPGESGFFSYLAYQNPDNWLFTQNSSLDPAPVLTISATPLITNNLPTGSTYQFGYYPEVSGPTSFVPIFSSPSTSNPQAISSYLNNNQNIHFALKITNSDGTYFWSTDATDNSLTDTSNNVTNPDPGVSHVIVLATPLPTTIYKNSGDSSGYTQLGGEYIFGFDTDKTVNINDTYADVIIALQLAGCP